MFDKNIEDIYDKINPGICSARGGKLYFERVSLDYSEGGKLYVIDDVPAFVCETCGEVWIPKPVVSELEKLVKSYSVDDTLENIDSEDAPKNKLNG